MRVNYDEKKLRDLSVLILEQENSVASDLTYSVMKAGGTVVGPATCAADADFFLDVEDIDVAIVGEFPASFKEINFAHRLEDLGIPFVFHVGQYSTAWDVIFPDVVVMQKGTAHDRIMSQLARLAEDSQSTGDFVDIDPAYVHSGYAEHAHIGSMIQ